MHNPKDKLDHFGRGVINHLRDNNYTHYLAVKKSFTQMPLADFINAIPEGMHEELKKERINSARFFQSLSQEQSDFLDRWMLEFVDQVAFNVMNVLDESRVDDSGLVVTMHGTDVTQLPLIGNGNLSGEYFDWLERFSQYERIF